MSVLIIHDLVEFMKSRSFKVPAKVEVKILEILTNWWMAWKLVLFTTFDWACLDWAHHLYFGFSSWACKLVILILFQPAQENHAEKSELVKWFESNELDKDTGKVVVRRQLDFFEFYRNYSKNSNLDWYLCVYRSNQQGLDLALVLPLPMALTILLKKL